MVMWGKKDDELPEALRGKTPEQIAEALRKATEFEQSVTSLTASKTDLETKLSTQQSEMEQLRTKMTELEANQKPPERHVEEEPTSIWTDPQKFVNEQLRPTQDVALMSGMMSAKLYARQGL